jgi:hypothetical protein
VGEQWGRKEKEEKKIRIGCGEESVRKKGVAPIADRR